MSEKTHEPGNEACCAYTKHRSDGVEIGFRLDSLEGSLKQAVTETLRAVLANDPPTLSFPALWGDGDGSGGPPPTDPAELRVGIGLGLSDDHCEYSLSLEAAVDDVIDYYVTSTGKAIEEGAEVCSKIAVRLRELAAKLESVLPT
jgi:hypothetical protein